MADLMIRVPEVREHVPPGLIEADVRNSRMPGLAGGYGLLRVLMDPVAADADSIWVLSRAVPDDGGCVIERDVAFVC